MKYVKIDDDVDEEGSEGKNDSPTDSNGNEEMPPAVKIGPPMQKGKKVPPHVKDSF